MKKTLKRENFTILILPPENRVSIQCVRIYEDGKFNMNGKLASVLGGQSFEIRFTKDAESLALFPAENRPETVRFPKSGSRKLPDATRFLTQNKFAFPAQYDVWFNEAESFWQGDLIANPARGRSKQRPNTKKN